MRRQLRRGNSVPTAANAEPIIPQQQYLLRGDPGPKGDSAYNLAQQDGFEGTVEEWLDSLVGIDGEDGAPGQKGDKGDKGDQGPQGIQGVVGPQGPAGPAGLTGATGATGPQGIQGATGAAGATGAQGPAGVNAFSEGVSRTIVAGSAYQATTTTKPAIITINFRLTSRLALSVLGVLTNAQAQQKAEVYLGDTAAKITAATGILIASPENVNTSTLLAGLDMVDTATVQVTIHLPAGYYFGFRVTAGTQVTVISCRDQQVG